MDIISFIKKEGYKVLIDFSAPIRDKIAILLLFINEDLYEFIWKKIKNRYQKDELLWIKKPIYVLQIGMTKNIGGLETYLMQQFEHINNNIVRYDFVNITGEYQKQLKFLIFCIIQWMKQEIIRYASYSDFST